MKSTPVEILDVVLFEPHVFCGKRRSFLEIFSQHQLEQEIARTTTFQRESHSCSVKNMLRGISHHIDQLKRKMVRVGAGDIFDVAVDVRKSSPTFGKWTGEIINAESKKRMSLPGTSCTNSSCYPITPNFSPRPPTTMHLNLSDAPRRTILHSATVGLSITNRRSLPKIIPDYH